MSEHFQYHPLRGNEIRVLRVDPLNPGESDLTPMRINLEHIDALSQEPRPSFWALSYVWGSPANQPTVYINGAPLEVTVNLHTALIQYRRHILGDLQRSEAGVEVLWVDAICINQGDVSERSLQVPRMAEIYGRCERVLAWLGPLSEEEDADVALLLEEMPGLDDGVIEENWEETPRAILIQGRLRKALATLGLRPWFHRVWILQEFVLSAKTPIVLCGRHIIDFGKFINIWNRLMWRMLESRGFSPSTLWKMSPNAYRDIKASHGKREGAARAGVASELLTFLDQANKLGATQAHDQIYALLGLVSDFQALPFCLQPDYKKPFGTVYHEYTTFLLRETGDTRMLLLGRLGTIPGVPSWVPDLRSRPPMEVTPGHAPKTDIAISADSKTLLVSAIVIGHVTHAFPSQGLLKTRTNKPYNLAPLLDIFGKVGNPEADPTGFMSTEERGAYPLSAFEAFEQAIIIPAAEIRQAEFEDVYQTWLRFRTRYVFGDRWQLMEPAFNVGYAYMRNGRTATSAITEECPVWGQALAMDRFLQLATTQELFLGSPQFVLDGGQTGSLSLGPVIPMPTCEVDDMVVLLQGCDHIPLLVRRSGGDRYKLISTVALDQYSSQYSSGLHVDSHVVEESQGPINRGGARGEFSENPVIKLEIV